MAYPHPPSDVGCVQGARPAKRHQCKHAWIFSLLDRDHAYGSHHVDIDDIEDAGGRGDGLQL